MSAQRIERWFVPAGGDWRLRFLFRTWVIGMLLALPFAVFAAFDRQLDGLEATRRIRALGKASLPIVALTASGEPEALSACVQAGMNQCLIKPVSLQMVQHMLELASTQ